MPVHDDIDDERTDEHELITDLDDLVVHEVLKLLDELTEMVMRIMSLTDHSDNDDANTLISVTDDQVEVVDGDEVDHEDDIECLEVEVADMFILLLLVELHLVDIVTVLHIY